MILANSPDVTPASGIRIAVSTTLTNAISALICCPNLKPAEATFSAPGPSSIAINIF
jgi:hypothetical protein